MRDPNNLWCRVLINITGPTLGWTPCQRSVRSTNLWLSEWHPRVCDDISWLHLLQLHDFLMLRIAVEQYKLLDPATDAFSVGATAHLTCCAHFRSDPKVTIKKQKMESLLSSLSIQLLRKVVNKVNKECNITNKLFWGLKCTSPPMLWHQSLRWPVLPYVASTEFQGWKKTNNFSTRKKRRGGDFSNTICMGKKSTFLSCIHLDLYTSSSDLDQLLFLFYWDILYFCWTTSCLLQVCQLALVVFFWNFVNNVWGVN